LSQEVFGHDREVPDAAPGGMEDGIGDRRRDAGDAELADALAAERADLRVVCRSNIELPSLSWGYAAW
jgi:hypothetical protein